MKLIAILLLCLLTLSITGKEIQMVTDEDLEDTEENSAAITLKVVGGLLVGGFGHRTSIAHCFHDSKYVFTHFQSAYNNLKQHSKSHVKSGIMDIGRALNKIPDTIKSCKDMKNIIFKIKHLIVVFSNPTLLAVDVGKNILWHGRSIYKQVKAAVSHWKAHSYYSFGVNIGYICNLVFLRMDGFGQELGNEGADFLDGFAHGLNPTVYEDAKQCIGDISQENLDRITRDINDLDWKHIDRSVKDIEDLVTLYISVVKDCKTGSQEFQDFVVKVINELNAISFVEAALKVIINPLKFARMVSNVHDDFKKHDLYDAGDVIGDFVGDVLSLHYAPVETFIKESM